MPDQAPKIEPGVAGKLVYDKDRRTITSVQHKVTTVVAGCRVHGDKPLTPETRAALEKVIEAAREQVAEIELPGKALFVCPACGQEQASVFGCADPQCPSIEDRLALAKASLYPGLPAGA